ncbi:MEI2-like protein 5 [Actinidia rufa]|uniref:MEI2-like protein 5 n=1 Tax=Actinidia rufa TaxID=165716 RepID=A0A7J0DTU5_9ERIC|nr:MEI2-like protein 5 [Actinidia rufa]
MQQPSEDTSSGYSKVQSNISKEMGSGAWGVMSTSDVYHASNDATLFSTSLPVLPHEKLNLNSTDHGCQSVDDTSSSLDKFNPDGEDNLLEDVANQIMIFFGSGGGMELESDPQESLSKGFSNINLSEGGGNGAAHYGFPNGVGTVAGEHPYGEHPSRTLFVRNINSNVEDSELRTLFEIRETPHKRHHKFIEFYDVRAAEAALRSLNRSDIAGSWPQFGSPIDRSPLQTNSPVFKSLSPTISNNLPGLSSVLHPRPRMLNSARVAPIGNERVGQVEHKFNNINTNHGSAFQQPHSLPDPKSHGFPYTAHHGSFVNSAHQHPHHHVGSAPSGIPFERHLGFYKNSSETSFVSPVGFGGSMGLGHSDVKLFGECNGHYPGLVPISMEGFERGWGRRIENNGNQIDSKKQFQLDLDKIKSGEDIRTTLMIKNIPNKYTSKMLLAAIDENNRGTYDFLYLPIDFKAFNGKKWEKFNSEKVASLAFARIQGKAALVTHFQNSSLMNEDKRCRPILFHSDGLETGDQIIQEHLPSNVLNVPVHQSYKPHLEDSPSSPLKGSPDEKLL